MNRYVYRALCSFRGANGKLYLIGQTIEYDEFKELPYVEQNLFELIDKRDYEY